MVTEIQKVGWWKQRINLCKKIWEPENIKWERYKNYYGNEHWLDDMADFPEVEDRITVNQSFPLIKHLLNSTYSKNPYIYVVPAHRDMQSLWASQILEPYINKQWNRDQNMKRTMRRVALDTLLRGKGYLRSGYSLRALSQTVFKDTIIGERISPLHFWFDPEAENVYEAYFTIRRVIMPWVDAKKMWPKKNIPPAAKYELQAMENPSKYSVSEWQNNPDVNDDHARAIVYEIHDHLNNKIIVIMDGYDKYLSNRDNPYNITGSLIDELCFNEIPETPFALPDLGLMEGQQLELNRLRTQMLIHNRRFNRKYLTTPENFDEDGKKAMESNQDGILVECDDPGAVTPLKDAPMSGDVHMYEAKIMQDLQTMASINQTQKGEAMHPRKSAFEAQQIAQGANIRAGEKPALMEDFASRVAEKQIKIMQQFLDEPIRDNLPNVPIGQPINQFGLKQFSRQDIQGEFRVFVKPGSAQIPDKGAQQQVLMMLLQSPVMNIPGVAQYVVQNLGDSLQDIVPGLGQSIQQGLQIAAQQQQQGGGGGQMQQQAQGGQR